MSNYRQRMAEKRIGVGPCGREPRKVEELRAKLDALQQKYDDCNSSRLYWRARCKELGAPELVHEVRDVVPADYAPQAAP